MFRYRLHQGEFGAPGSWWLEGYYKLGESMDKDLDQRNGDINYWKAMGKEV